MARENERWGYKRIAGALGNLGYPICKSTVANILKSHGIEPAPERKRQMSWGTSLKAHLDCSAEVNLTALSENLNWCWRWIVEWIYDRSGLSHLPAQPRPDHEGGTLSLWVAGDRSDEPVAPTRHGMTVADGRTLGYIRPAPCQSSADTSDGQFFDCRAA